MPRCEASSPPWFPLLIGTSTADSKEKFTVHPRYLREEAELKGFQDLNNVDYWLKRSSPCWQLAGGQQNLEK